MHTNEKVRLSSSIVLRMPFELLLKFSDHIGLVFLSG